MQLAEHPTVKQFREQEAAGHLQPHPQKLDAAWLRQLCLLRPQPKTVRALAGDAATS